MIITIHTNKIQLAVILPNLWKYTLQLAELELSICIYTKILLIKDLISTAVCKTIHSHFVLLLMAPCLIKMLAKTF